MAGRARHHRWHVERGQDVLTLSRCRPARFDLAVEAVLPVMEPLRLAHQIRQDMWRALRDLRGFAPAVRVARSGDVLHVTAGGAVAGPVPRAQAEAAIRAVLDNPANRARWQGYAKVRAHV
ncbi:hypothetical protein [Lacimonas salitolerans]|uniref:Uncharacterized protein n=1 Tax=Lacimonas salitolerans TaxID=1323750 RepID=A0ABW4EAM4_9RHOB